MGRKSTITQDEVFDAVRELIEAGEYPNPANVRAKLDNRGSPPLVQTHIGAWYREFGPELAHKAAAKPKAPAASLKAQLRLLTTEAMQELEAAEAQRVAELDAREQTLKEKEETLTAREAALLAQEARLSERELAQHELVRTITATSEAAIAAKDAAVSALATAEAANAVQAARISELEAAVADTAAVRGALSDAKASLASSESTLAAVCRERDKLSERDASLTQELRRLSALDAEVRHARDEVKHQRKQVLDLMEQLKRANYQLEACRGDRNAFEEKAATTLASLSDTRIELATVRANLGAAESTARRLEEEKATMAAALEAAYGDRDRMGENIDALQRTLNDLGERFDRSVKAGAKKSEAG